MAFDQKDAAKHFPRVKGHSVAARQWVHVANRYLEKGYPEKDAIEVANGVVEKRGDLGEAVQEGGDERDGAANRDEGW